MKKIALIGMMGCGKSSIGKRIADKLGYGFADLDEEIVRREGRDIAEIFSQDREGYFRRTEYETLESLLDKAAEHCERLVLSCGGGTPAYKDSALMLDRDCFCIYLKLSPKTLADRISAQGGTAGRPMLSGARDVRERIGNLLRSRASAYNRIANLIIDCENKDMDSVCDEICDRLSGRKFGLIGDPIAHSLSPRLFNAAFDGEFRYDLIEGNDFALSYEKFLDGYEAVNVTAPFKGKAMEAATEVNELAAAAEACNILIKKNSRRILAYNSDASAVSDMLLCEEDLWDKAGKDTEKPKVLVLGCGGAGRAAVAAAVISGAEVTLLNRNVEKAEAFAERLDEKMRKGLCTPVKIVVSGLKNLKESVDTADIVIYTLPCRIEGIVETLSAAQCTEKLIIEANYKDPCLDKLPRSHRYIGGKEWLIRQAVAGFGIMAAENIDEEKIRRAI